MKKKILVISAHPDDEILGCGASMSYFSRKGYIINTLILSRGIDSRKNEKNKKTKKAILEIAAIKANKIVGSKKIDFENFPDNKFDTVPLLEVVQSIESKINNFKPSIILTHHFNDLNIDHEVVNRATIIATRPIPKRNKFKILTYEVNSSTDWANNNKPGKFSPNYFIKVSKTDLKKKVEALKCYKTEMRKWPHTRSISAIKNLSKLRGSSVGLEYAESFHLFRQIDF